MPTPTTSRSAQVAAALAHLAWTTLVLVGAPVALWRFFGWPLPSEMPDWGEVASTSLHLVDPIVVLNTFVCLAWACWGIIAIYVALDLFDSARGVGQRLHRIGPFSTIAGKLAGSVVLLTTFARPAATLAAPAPPTPVIIVEDPTASSTSPGPPTLRTHTTPTDERPTLAGQAPLAGPDEVTHVVQRGDSLWAIAEDRLGDGFRWREIHDLNRDRITDPNLICIGWQLTLPADARNAAPPAPDEPVTPAPATPEPAAPAPVTPETSDPSPAPEAATSESLDSAPEPAAPSEQTNAGEPAAAPPSGGARNDGSERVAVAPTREVSSGSPERAATPPEGSVDPTEDAMMPALVSAVPGITGATVLATGVLLALRRRQRGPGPLARRHVGGFEKSLVAAADLPLVRWVGQELAILGELIAGRGHPAVPVAVEFSEDTGIEILWDQPFPDAPAPWEATPGAWSWRTLYDPDAPVPIAERPSPIPGLVTIGQRDGRQLMINLETFGTLTIHGDTQGAANLVRSMILELATCAEIADTTVAVTNDLHLAQPLAGLAIDVLQAHEAMDALDEVHRNAEQVLDGIDTDTTFGYRTYGPPVLPFPVTVVAAHPAVPAAEEAAEQVLADRGGALILLGDSPSAAAEILVQADGTAIFEPFAITFTAANLPRLSRMLLK